MHHPHDLDVLDYSVRVLNDTNPSWRDLGDSSIRYVLTILHCTTPNCEVRSEPSESGAAGLCWPHHMTCQFFFDCP